MLEVEAKKRQQATQIKGSPAGPGTGKPPVRAISPVPETDDRHPTRTEAAALLTVSGSAARLSTTRL
jgi:hypothetical protein